MGCVCERVEEGELHSNAHGGGHCIAAPIEGCVHDDDWPSQ